MSSRALLGALATLVFIVGCDTQEVRTSCDTQEVEREPLNLDQVREIEWGFIGFQQGKHLVDPGTALISFQITSGTLLGGFSVHNSYSAQYDSSPPNAFEVTAVWSTLAGEPDGSKLDEYLQYLDSAREIWLAEERLHIEYAPDCHVLLFEPYEEPDQ